MMYDIFWFLGFLMCRCLDRSMQLSETDFSIMASSFDVEVQAEEKDYGNQEGYESEEDELLQ